MTRKLINIRLDVDLWRKTKIQAATEGKTLQDYVEQVLAESLNGAKKGGSNGR